MKNSNTFLKKLVLSLTMVSLLSCNVTNSTSPIVQQGEKEKLSNENKFDIKGEEEWADINSCYNSGGYPIYHFDWVDGQPDYSTLIYYGCDYNGDGQADGDSTTDEDGDEGTGTDDGTGNNDENNGNGGSGESTCDEYQSGNTFTAQSFKIQALTKDEEKDLKEFQYLYNVQLWNINKTKKILRDELSYYLLEKTKMLISAKDAVSIYKKLRPLDKIKEMLEKDDALKYANKPEILEMINALTGLIDSIKEKTNLIMAKQNYTINDIEGIMVQKFDSIDINSVENQLEVKITELYKNNEVKPQKELNKLENLLENLNKRTDSLKNYYNYLFIKLPYISFEDNYIARISMYLEREKINIEKIEYEIRSSGLEASEYKTTGKIAENIEEIISDINNVSNELKDLQKEDKYEEAKTLSDTELQKLLEAIVKEQEKISEAKACFFKPKPTPTATPSPEEDELLIQIDYIQGNSQQDLNNKITQFQRNSEKETIKLANSEFFHISKVKENNITYELGKGKEHNIAAVVTFISKSIASVSFNGHVEILEENYNKVVKKSRFHANVLTNKEIRISKDKSFYYTAYIIDPFVWYGRDEIANGEVVGPGFVKPGRYVTRTVVDTNIPISNKIFDEKGYIGVFSNYPEYTNKIPKQLSISGKEHIRSRHRLDYLSSKQYDHFAESIGNYELIRDSFLSKKNPNKDSLKHEFAALSNKLVKDNYSTDLQKGTGTYNLGIKDSVIMDNIVDVANMFSKYDYWLDKAKQGSINENSIVIIGKRLITSSDIEVFVDAATNSSLGEGYIRTAYPITNESDKTPNRLKITNYYLNLCDNTPTVFEDYMTSTHPAVFNTRKLKDLIGNMN